MKTLSGAQPPHPYRQPGVNVDEENALHRRLCRLVDACDVEGVDAELRSHPHSLCASKLRDAYTDLVSKTAKLNQVAGELDAAGRPLFGLLYRMQAVVGPITLMLGFSVGADALWMESAAQGAVFGAGLGFYAHALVPHQILTALRNRRLDRAHQAVNEGWHRLNQAYNDVCAERR